VANLPDIGDKWADLNLEERRSILKAALDCVFVRRSLRGTGGTPVSQRARVLFRGEGPADLPGTGRRIDFDAFAWHDDPNDVRVAAA
jgi:hypothetical protein